MKQFGHVEYYFIVFSIWWLKIWVSTRNCCHISTLPNHPGSLMLRGKRYSVSSLSGLTHQTCCSVHGEMVSMHNHHDCQWSFKVLHFIRHPDTKVRRTAGWTWTAPGSRVPLFFALGDGWGSPTQQPENGHWDFIFWSGSTLLWQNLGWWFHGISWSNHHTVETITAKRTRCPF